MQKYLFPRAVCLIGIFFSCSITFAAEPVASRLMYLQDGLGQLQKSEKRIAIDAWNEWMAQNGDYPLVTTWVTAMTDFLEMIKMQKVDYALLGGSNLIQYYQQLKPDLKDEVWVIQRSENIYEEFVLLIRNEHSATKLSDLKGTTLSLDSDSGLLKMYLQYLVKKTADTSIDNYFKVIRQAKTESHSILDVFFGYTDVCLVPKHILDNAIALNPVIRDQVKIIHRSGEIFVPAVHVAFNNASDIAQTRFSDSIEKLHNTIRGQQLLNLFGIYKIQKIELKMLFPMLNLNAQLH